MSETAALLVHGFIPSGVRVALGAPARTVDCGHGLVAVVTPAPGLDARRLFDDPERVARLALDHNGVLSSLLGQSDVLPLQLGTVVSGDDALRAIVHANGPHLHAALATVAGCVEFGVTLSAQPVAEAPPTVTDGRGWLQARAAVQRARRGTLQERPNLIRRARDAITAAARGPVQFAATPGHALLRAACLVTRADVPEFEARIAALETDLAGDGCTVALTGPWPPYSFVSLETERRSA